MNIREDIINTIKHNDPLDGPMVLIPGKIFSKLLNPDQSQENEVTEDGHIFPWTMDENTIKYIMENNGELISVENLMPEEILIIKKYLIDKDNSGHTHEVIEIRSKAAEGDRYLRRGEPTLEELMQQRIKSTGKGVQEMLKDGTYAEFCDSTRAEHQNITNNQ